MWSEIVQGVLGIGAIGYALKLLIPILQSRLGADAARAGLDESTHRMIQDLMTQCRLLSDGLATAQGEVVKLTAELTVARRELEHARLLLQSAGKQGKDLDSMEVSNGYAQ